MSENHLDVMDRGGRVRRTMLALIVGACAAAIAYPITYAIVANDLGKPHYYIARNMSADRFLVYATALAGFLAFVVTLAVASKLSARAWRRDNEPSARLLR